MPRSTLVLLVALIGTVAGSAWWILATCKPRRLTIDHSIQVEFALQEPVTVLVQTRGPDQAWLPFAYATLGTGYGAELFVPGDLDEASVTIGVGGTLHDAATGKDFTEVQAGTWSAARSDRNLLVRGATPMASLQTRKGTRLNVDVKNGALVSSANPLDGR